MLRPVKDWLAEITRLETARHELRVISRLRNRREAQAYRLLKLNRKLNCYETRRLYRFLFGG